MNIYQFDSYIKREEGRDSKSEVAAAYFITISTNQLTKRYKIVE